ncbi:MAG: lamin tail domain-containing protein [Nannocystaceae bacterium]|nr:lamin tail domain-containing protein [Nannocystaceae bacterium]
MFRHCSPLWGCALALWTGCGGAPTEASGSSTGDTSTSSTASSSSTGPSTLETSADASSGSSSSSTATTSTAESSSTSESASADSSSSGGSSSTGEPQPCHPILHEIVNATASSDEGNEWIELYNPCDVEFDLSGYTLGWGGTNYNWTQALEGTLAPQGCFVVGGPNSDADNGNPVYDQVANFEADLENGGNMADGIALFDIPQAELDALVDTPVDAMIYGTNNTSQLRDETGNAGDPDAPDTSDDNGYARADADAAAPWVVSSLRSPGQCPNQIGRVGGPALAPVPSAR